MFPRNIKHTFVVGIFKGGVSSDLANYRPISLTFHASKVIEGVVRIYIVKFMDDNELWDERQFGSRAGISSLSQLFLHHNKMVEAMENCDKIYVIYLDFSKAYNKFNHYT